MILESIQPSSLTIPFTAAFRHASAERSATCTLWVQARSRSGLTGFGEGCPREYVSGESIESGLAFIAKHAGDWQESIHDLDTLVEWIARHRSDIDANPAAWTAVELALLDLLGKEAHRPVESLLRLPELSGIFRYTAVLGDSSPPQFELQLANYLHAGFRDFKIKLSGELTRDAKKAQSLRAAGVVPHRVRADANNLWSDPEAAISHLQALDFPFFAVEEPLQAGDWEGMRRIASSLDTTIVLDETLLRVAQLERCAGSGQRWILNLRVSKMGGLVRSLEMLDQARRHGLPVIVGAHVGETSLLTRAGLTVAHSARDILIAQEGAFGTRLLAEDVVDPPLMFGKGGLLDVTRQGLAQREGFGLLLGQAVTQFNSLDNAST